MKKALTQINEQRLNLVLQKSDYTTAPAELNTTRNGKKSLEQLARKWASRGYYPTLSEAMKVLLGSV